MGKMENGKKLYRVETHLGVEETWATSARKGYEQCEVPPFRHRLYDAHAKLARGGGSPCQTATATPSARRAASCTLCAICAHASRPVRVA